MSLYSIDDQAAKVFSLAARAEADDDRHSSTPCPAIADGHSFPPGIPLFVPVTYLGGRTG